MYQQILAFFRKKKKGLFYIFNLISAKDAS